MTQHQPLITIINFLGLSFVYPAHPQWFLLFNFCAQEMVEKNMPPSKIKIFHNSMMSYLFSFSNQNNNGQFHIKSTTFIYMNKITASLFQKALSTAIILIYHHSLLRHYENKINPFNFTFRRTNL